MPIKVQCGSCGTALKAPDQARGKTLKCPKCTAPIAVPAQEDFSELIPIDDPAVDPLSQFPELGGPAPQPGFGAPPPAGFGAPGGFPQQGSPQPGRPQGFPQQGGFPQQNAPGGFAPAGFGGGPQYGGGRSSGSSSRNRLYILLGAGGLAAVIFIGLIIYFVFGSGPGFRGSSLEGEFRPVAGAKPGEVEYSGQFSSSRTGMSFRQQGGVTYLPARLWTKTDGTEIRASLKAVPANSNEIELRRESGESLVVHRADLDEIDNDYLDKITKRVADLAKQDTPAGGDQPQIDTTKYAANRLDWSNVQNFEVVDVLQPEQPSWQPARLTRGVINFEHVTDHMSRIPIDWTAPVFSKDGRYAAVGIEHFGHDQTKLIVFDVVNQKVLAQKLMNCDTMIPLAFSPDGKTLMAYQSYSMGGGFARPAAGSGTAANNNDGKADADASGDQKNDGKQGTDQDGDAGAGKQDSQDDDESGFGSSLPGFPDGFPTPPGFGQGRSGGRGQGSGQDSQSRAQQMMDEARKRSEEFRAQREKEREERNQNRENFFEEGIGFGRSALCFWTIDPSKRELTFQKALSVDVQVAASGVYLDDNLVAVTGWRQTLVIDVTAEKVVRQTSRSSSNPIAGGNRFASALPEKVIDLATGKVAPLSLGDEKMSRGDFSPDGRYLACANDDVLRVLDVSSGGQVVVDLPPPTGPVPHIHFVGDRYLLAGSQLYDLELKSPVLMLEMDIFARFDPVLTHDGSSIAYVHATDPERGFYSLVIAELVSPQVQQKIDAYAALPSYEMKPGVNVTLYAAGVPDDIRSQLITFFNKDGITLSDNADLVIDCRVEEGWEETARVRVGGTLRDPVIEEHTYTPTTSYCKYTLSGKTFVDRKQVNQPGGIIRGSVAESLLQSCKPKFEFFVRGLRTRGKIFAGPMPTLQVGPRGLTFN